MTLGFTLTYLSLIVLIPLAGADPGTTALRWEEFWRIASSDRVRLPRLRVSFGVSLARALRSTRCSASSSPGCWCATSFPGAASLDAIVDLPFALPTAVAGIALTAIFAKNGWIGQFIEPLGIKVAYTPTGIVIALIFIGLPFVVRTLQPVLEDIDRETKRRPRRSAPRAGRPFSRVVLPTLLPALLTGFALALARAVGEYGSVIFIAGNIPYRTEIAPLLIVIRLTEFDYAGATAIATIMLAISFVLLLIINLLQAWARRRFGMSDHALAGSRATWRSPSDRSPAGHEAS